MDFSLPSDHGVFQAANYQELMTYAGIPRGKMKLKEAFLPLFAPRDKADEAVRRLRLANLTVFDMSILMFGKPSRHIAFGTSFGSATV